MYVSPLRLAGLAAVFAVAIVSAAWFGRLTASSSTGGPGPTPTASADASLLDSYRTARREICLRYKPQIDPLIQQLEGIYQPETPTADRASKIRALTQLVTLGEQANAEIAALVVSPDMATDAAVAVDQMHQQNVLIHAELDRFAAGDLAGAESLDQATNPLAEEIAAFDRKYGVPSC